MSKHHPELLAEIEAFVADAGMSEITFGRRTMSDPHFVRDIRNGRRLWPETVDKLHKRMVIVADEVAAARQAGAEAA
ncbi:hypothetical protein [Novosphingobium sp. 9]|uniref:hypothetical protein n=1 Tax=Novosphingobium sp. 9 TaxID=2025349 RepID=UPI0021B69579|nr:hypothetical protein [Novosphingobium sp. 9]